MAFLPFRRHGLGSNKRISRISLVRSFSSGELSSPATTSSIFLCAVLTTCRTSFCQLEHPTILNFILFSRLGTHLLISTMAPTMAMRRLVSTPAVSSPHPAQLCAAPSATFLPRPVLVPVANTGHHIDLSLVEESVEGILFHTSNRYANPQHPGRPALLVLPRN